mmetsp:Transcript_13067/g.23681  ORF Transcript_13067/g.23681 Transcript_13067/m.23681 type:complete len:511 (-) Transcript_13067:207-1739(-)
MVSFKAAALALVTLGSARAQFDNPVPKWTATFRPMLDNTGLVWAPDDSAVYATSSDGAVALFSPDDGTLLGEFQPSGDGTVPFSCNGEVDFNSAGDTVIYAVTEGDSCKVYALGHGSLDVKWESPELAGACEGTPRYADEDAYVFVTHNAADGSAGRFSVLDTAAGATVIYTTEVTEGPFGPFGFYPSPFPGGNYGAGAGNTNDLAVWGLKPSPSATGGENGGVWAFQMPPTTALGGPNVTKIVETTSWRHTSPPLIANMGQWAYWLVSRSAIRAWYSSPWTVGADGEYSFDRGVPSFKAAPYTPASNGDVPTIMCGGPADASFACMDATNIVPSEEGGAPLWSVNTTGTGVYGDPVMSPDYSRVYWADNAGLVSSADPNTGMDGWTAPAGVILEANPVLSSDGGRLFFADVTGIIACWDVAETTLPVPAPPVPGPGAPAPAPSMESLAPSSDGTGGGADTSMPTVAGAGGGPPGAPPTPAGGGGTPTSAGSSVAVFSVIAASIVAALFL